MHEFPLHKVPEHFRDAHIDTATYETYYRQSVENPDTFWSRMAGEFLDWFEPWHTVRQYDFVKGEARWFDGGVLNVAYNCIDRHLPGRAEQVAIVWEGDDPGDSQPINYIVVQ